MKTILDLDVLFGHIVYWCFVGEECVYVGRSRHGLHRVFDKKHPTAKTKLTKIEVETFASAKGALNEEQVQLFKLKPRMNTYGVMRERPSWYITAKTEETNPRYTRILDLRFERGLSARRIADVENVSMSAVQTIFRNLNRKYLGLRQDGSGTKKQPQQVETNGEQKAYVKRIMSEQKKNDLRAKHLTMLQRENLSMLRRMPQNRLSITTEGHATK